MAIAFVAAAIAVVFLIVPLLSNIEKSAFDKGQLSAEEKLQRIQSRAIEGSQKVSEFDPELLRQVLRFSIRTVFSTPNTSIYVTLPKHHSIDVKPFVMLWMQEKICQHYHFKLPESGRQQAWSEWEEVRQQTYGRLSDAEKQRIQDRNQREMESDAENPAQTARRDQLITSVSELLDVLLDYKFLEIHEKVVPIQKIVSNGFVSQNIHIDVDPSKYSSVPHRCLRLMLGPAVFAPHADLWQGQATLLEEEKAYDLRQRFYNA